MPTLDNGLLPLLVDPQQLAAQLTHPALRIIEVGQGQPKFYSKGHIPQAVYLPYASLLSGQAPAVGQLPELAQLSALFSQCGLTPETHIVAYDDDRGGSACRLLWTLDAIGHRHFSLLNGGLYAWQQAGLTLSRTPAQPHPSSYVAQLNSNAIANLEYIQQHLNHPQVQLLDARSLEEYHGHKAYARRAGHIPGAIHWDWLEMMTPDHRMKPASELRALCQQRGLNLQHEIVTYCQTHHRSSYSYIALKTLGCQQVKGYAGSWSEWGNQLDTPIAH